MKKIYIFLIILLVSCVAKDLDPRKLDPSMNADYQELKDKLLPKEADKDTAIPEDNHQEPQMPHMASIIAPPPEPMIGQDKLVSISISDDVPLKEVFIELSRLADVDIEIDPAIKGGVILRSRNRPFSEVVDRICDLSNLRYSNKNGTLRVENDNPFLVNYSLDFLNIIRNNSGSTSLSTGLSGASSGGGSTTNLSSKYENDLWGSIEADIKKIFAQSASSSFGGGAAPANYITSNKQAGIVGIYATNKQHKMIKSYLEKVKDSTSAQVLIEAKIVEISLNDQYQSGVNFDMLNSYNTNPGIGNVGGHGTGFSGLGAPIEVGENIFSLTSRINEGKFTLNSLVQLSETFGAARTLSSPRIHAMNNQQAVLSFVDNQVYFSVTVQNNAGTISNSGISTGSQVTLNSTSHTVPIGVILTLQPSINLDTEEITMNIRPTITTTDGNDPINDPAVAFAIAQAAKDSSGSGDKSVADALKAVNASVPVVSVKELDSILKIKNGEIMVIGGMMNDSSKNTDTGTPFLMSVPLLGNLFKTVSKTNQTKQTVIFIQATIVPSDGLKKKDKDMYNNFAVDKEVRI